MDNNGAINEWAYYEIINKNLLNPDEIIYRVQVSESDYLYPKFRDEEAAFVSAFSNKRPPYAFTKKALLTRYVLEKNFINVLGVKVQDYNGRIIATKGERQ